ncbi:hypothetical protein CPB85DRAFT_1223639 [Mucidula mucida]|nr:hypothetical protein CPB85DRAFT_1223639 [Mucidula mucida]
MLTWRPYRDLYLQELLRLDGCGDNLEICSRCSTDDISNPAIYRCCENECHAAGLVCSDCCVSLHAMLPLHWIEKWNGTFFEPSSLREIGAVVQLGHPAGKRCPLPIRTTNSFTVLHTNGIHSLNLYFCGCSAAAQGYIQLLRGSWYPSTPREPRTASTFSLLRLFHNLNCLGKLPAWDLWKALETMTEHRTLCSPPQRYQVLLRSIRQWRHLKLLKRAGRGHTSSGVSGTALGELVVACPACPHPSRNLPPDWESISAEKKFIYILFLAIDANFRLRNAVVSTAERDPPLGDGWAFFVEQAPYNEHVRSFVSQEDMATCSGFKATFLADLKNAKGLRTTGIAGVTCSRHGVWRPNGMGDLQRGERFCNVDPLVAISMGGDNSRLDLVLSYDIVCIWGVHFPDRLTQLPLQWRLNFDPNRVRFCVPKFHLWAHRVQCHALYSFNFLVGVGRTHGETIEENWAQSNRAAAQTKMMGPGARKDTLDDIFGAHNYLNMINLIVIGRVLLARLAEAIREARTHAREFKDFNAGMVTFCGNEAVKTWEREVLLWDQDHSQPCPYEPRLQNKETMRDVQLQLAQEEKTTLQNGSVSHESSMSLFLALGLEIEEKQRGLAWEIKVRRSGTTYQALDVERQRNVILRDLKRFRRLQLSFMPMFKEYLTDDQKKVLDSPASVLPEETKLFLPSELREADRELPRACVVGLAHAETRLREAECRDALESLRRGLRTRSAGHLFTVRNVTGQNPTTRAEGVQRKVQVSIYLSKLRYRWARNALFRLRKHGDWERELRVLNDVDVRGMNERLLTAEEIAERRILAEQGFIDELIAGPSSEGAVVSQGEGRRQLSWIWYSYADPIDTLKIEWCKARARKMRWEEEVELLLEEMRRVIVYRRWNAEIWRERGRQQRAGLNAKCQQGLSAFAAEQASIQDSVADDLESHWMGIRALGQELLAGLPVSRVVEVELEEEEDGGDSNQDDLDVAEV